MSIKNTVLIIGGTSGIGEGLARAIHAQGKKVIATGRNTQKLSSLAAELPGLETSTWDFSEINSIKARTSELTQKYPDLDTVIVNAGVQNIHLFKDAEDGAKVINEEVTTNLTAPIVFAQAIVPFFLKADKPTSIILISSGLAFVPFKAFPVYCPTKAAIHLFAVALRSQLDDTNIHVGEVFPPYVDTGLDAKFQDRMKAMRGGAEGPKAMPVKEFTEQLMAKFDAQEDGKPLREIPIGAFPEAAASAWRGAMGKWIAMFGGSG